MAGQCETKPLLLTPALVSDPAWREGKMHPIFNGRHRCLAKSRDLSVKDLAATCVHWVVLRYRGDPTRVVTDRDRRTYWFLETQTDETAALREEADNFYRAWDVAMDMVPTLRATYPSISQTKLVAAVSAELRAEGGAKHTTK